MQHQGFVVCKFLAGNEENWTFGGYGDYVLAVFDEFFNVDCKENLLYGVECGNHFAEELVYACPDLVWVTCECLLGFLIFYVYGDRIVGQAVAPRSFASTSSSIHLSP